MNAPMEPASFRKEETKELEIPDIVLLYGRRLNELDSRELQEGLQVLLKNIAERMKARDLDRALAGIHNITREYTLYSTVTIRDIAICGKLYSNLLAEHDRMYNKVFPDQFSKRTDQILKKTPE